MSCETFRESILGRLYGENSATADDALTVHLSSCSACRDEIDALARVSEALRDGEPQVARAPRLLVLHDRPAFRPALLAASILGAALVAGAAAGGGYAWVRGRTAPSGPAPSAPALAAAASPAAAPADRVPAPAATQEAVDRPMTRAEVDAAIARFERRIDSARAADMQYVLTQLEASEARSGQRIGRTNQALRNVALASNPGIGAQ